MRQPFTNHFPRADIHELLTPDLLHQLIKGTFKDHLVSWVSEYIYSVSETRKDAKRVIDEIDRRYAITASSYQAQAHLSVQTCCRSLFPWLTTLP